VEGRPSTRAGTWRIESVLGSAAIELSLERHGVAMDDFFSDLGREGRAICKVAERRAKVVPAPDEFIGDLQAVFDVVPAFRQVAAIALAD